MKSKWSGILYSTSAEILLFQPLYQTMWLLQSIYNFKRQQIPNSEWQKIYCITSAQIEKHSDKHNSTDV